MPLWRNAHHFMTINLMRKFIKYLKDLACKFIKCLKGHRFWVIWAPLSLLWILGSLWLTCIYGDSTRGLALLVAAPLVAIGLHFSSKRTKVLESENKINRDRLLTETFAKSIELLGNEQEAVRLGAIYALGKIAETNKDEFTVVVNTLCAFIRHNQSYLEYGKLDDEKKEELKKLTIDIEAAVRTIAKLTEGHGEDINSTKYDLSNIYLRYADFSNANLSNFNLSDSWFYECIFEKVNFLNSNLVASNFGKSAFGKARFNEKTEIKETDFSKAIELSEEITQAIKDDKTKFPEYITKPNS